MWKALTELLKRYSDHRKQTLQHKIQNIKMENNETIMKYLSKFTQFHEKLGRLGVNVVKDDLVSLAILGLHKSWHSYQDLVNGREKL